MVITIAEGLVPSDRETDLKEAWRDTTAKALPPGLVESWLIHSDGQQWRIVTVWESAEALERMRASTSKPGAVEMFERAGITPTVSICSVEGHVTG